MPNDNSPPSVAPSGVPGAPTPGSGQYVIVAAILLLFIGAVVVYKFVLSGSGEQPTTVASAPVKSAAPKPAFTDTLPPVATEEPTVPTASASASAAKGVGGVGGGCSGVCSGTAAPGFAGELSAAGAAAQGCYKGLLSKSENAAGKMRVSIRVDSTGSVCSASATADPGVDEIKGCVTNIFKGKKFSAPTGGCVEGSVPLNFAPKNK